MEQLLNFSIDRVTELIILRLLRPGLATSCMYCAINNLVPELRAIIVHCRRFKFKYSNTGSHQTIRSAASNENYSLSAFFRFRRRIESNAEVFFSQQLSDFAVSFKARLECSADVEVGVTFAASNVENWEMKRMTLVEETCVVFSARLVVSSRREFRERCT